jgi:hypothetical protein
MMLPSAQTACSHTFWWEDSSSFKNNGAAPAKQHNKQ